VSQRVDVGSEIAGYRVTGLIGQGGMATVYLAESLAGEGRSALKVMAPELARNADFRTRFLREARYASSVEHPNIVRVRDVGEFDGLLYIVMDYVEGSDLEALLTLEGVLDPERAVSILGQVAGALDAIHATGLLHRDVRPGNVIVTLGPDGEERCYLTDFGLSKNPVQDSRALTAAGDFVGSCYYSAPEQILGRDYDQRVDVYSLGCLLVQCLTGEPPFRGDSEAGILQAHIEEPAPGLLERRPDLPPALDAVVTKAMAKSPDARYDSCTQLMAAARAGLAAEPTARARGARVPIAGAGPEGSRGEEAGTLRLKVTAGNALGDEILVWDEFLIGRHAPGEGKLGDDIEISRRHARISRADAEYVIEDLGSTNGTIVNGRRITAPEPLSVGDTIEVGTTTLVVQVTMPPAPAATDTPVQSRPVEAAAVEPAEADVEPPADPATEPSAPPRLSLRIEVDLESREARLELDPESEPVRLVFEDGRWRLADGS
jgi:serine/threonine-protein kinase